jgi:hypothetical protein
MNVQNQRKGSHIPLDRCYIFLHYRCSFVLFFFLRKGVLLYTPIREQIVYHILKIPDYLQSVSHKVGLTYLHPSPHHTKGHNLYRHNLLYISSSLKKKEHKKSKNIL